VGWFIISNTFGILVAQRTKELALLRAIGAGRRQVLGSVLLEAGIVGVVSSVIGFFSGVALAFGAFAGLEAIGFGLPQSDLVITPDIALRATIAGLGITLVAAIGPAIKATRVPPMAALRDVAVDRAGRSWIRTGIGVVLLIFGLLSILPAFGEDPSSDQIPGVGFGLGLILLSVLTLGPIFSGPLARLIGSPLPKVAGFTGTLARQNAVRSPRRTASTAAAIIIGVALISFITAFAESAKASVNDAIGTNFKGDFVVLPINQFSFSGVSPDLATEISAIDGVEVVTAFGVVPGQLQLPNGDEPTGVIGGVDPATFGQLFDIKMAEGSLEELTDDTIVVDRAVARDADIAIGDEISITAPGGRAGTFTVVALSDDPALLGQWTLSRGGVNLLSAQPSDFQIGVKNAPGADFERVRADIKDVLEANPTMKVQDEEQFASGIADSINVLLNVIYALLVVSVFIALIGIVNTLSLSIHERTRELGLLRAVGMGRRQIRISVWWEAAIVTIMGTAIGMFLGLSLSYTMVKALVSQGITTYQVPVFEIPGMAIIVAVALVLGVAASVWPSFKASRLNVLDAIATE
jgi:putative ABC transport system permease protein